jgi:hypothetical protein
VWQSSSLSGWDFSHPSRVATHESGLKKRALSHTEQVFYFFTRETMTVTCDMRPSATGTGFDIVIMETAKPVVTEHFSTSEEVHQRWKELRERFKGEGWWGPAISNE